MKKGLFKLVAFDWIKGAIVAVFVAVLTYIQQLVMDGSQVSIKIIFSTAITALLGYMIKQLMTDDNGSVLSMIGGRKKRKKKPTSFNNGAYEFTENLFTIESVVTYRSDLSIDESVTVSGVYNSLDAQTVAFNEPINFNDFETILFEVEVD